MCRNDTTGCLRALIAYSGGIHCGVTEAAEIGVKKDRWAAQQGLARLPFCAGVEGYEKIHHAAGAQRDRYSIAIEQAIAGQRRELRPRG